MHCTVRALLKDNYFSTALSLTALGDVPADCASDDVLLAGFPEAIKKNKPLDRLRKRTGNK